MTRKLKLPKPRPGVQQIVRQRTPEQIARDKTLRASLSVEREHILAKAHAHREATDWAGTLSEERLRRGMSFADLADVTGMQRAALQKLLTGQVVNPKLETVQRVAESLGYEVEIRLKRAEV